MSHERITIINQQIAHSDSAPVRKRETVTRKYKTALLLSIFLGWAGIDRFYVGHTPLGILKLFLCFTIWGALIWWIIDIILFATKNVNYVKWE
jgi:TM2 domain-containing membrane protein YozV